MYLREKQLIAVTKLQFATCDATQSRSRMEEYYAYVYSKRS